MRVLELAHCTWEDVRELDRGRAVPILPVGAVEAHGPHLPLDTDVVMAYVPSRWGTVDPDAIGDGLTPVELEASQLEYLQGLERMVGGVLVAYRLKVD